MTTIRISGLQEYLQKNKRAPTPLFSPQQLGQGDTLLEELKHEAILRNKRSSHLSKTIESRRREKPN
jgi:hypothetical protein